MYSYEEEKSGLLGDEGQRWVLACAAHARRLCERSGAATMEFLMQGYEPCPANSWAQLAVVDRLVEVGVLREVEQRQTSAAQHRIFMLKERG